MQLNHLNLQVRDITRARQFYERYFGFAAGEAIWHGDVLFLRNAHGSTSPSPRAGTCPPHRGSTSAFAWRNLSPSASCTAA